MKLLNGDLSYGREVTILTDQGERVKRKVRYSAKYGLHVIVNEQIYTSEDLQGTPDDVSVHDLAKKFCKQGVTCSTLRQAVEKHLYAKQPKLDISYRYRCSECNALLDSSGYQKFCSNCGQKISWELDKND